MNLASVEAILAAVVNIINIAAPLVEKSIDNAKPFAEIIYKLFTGTTITDDDITNYLAQANALSAQIQASTFIPPKQDDDI